MLALCVLAVGLRSPERGYTLPPGCWPGYWVRLATGESLFCQGEEVGEVAHPKGPDVSTPVVSGQT